VGKSAVRLMREIRSKTRHIADVMDFRVGGEHESTCALTFDADLITILQAV
jgi:hypothetical protein